MDLSFNPIRATHPKSISSVGIITQAFALHFARLAMAALGEMISIRITETKVSEGIHCFIVQIRYIMEARASGAFDAI
jgi:hypothetical protein